MRPACAIGLLFWATAIAAGEPLYRLPWDDSRSFMIIQAPDGRITTHITKATFHAVDIEMPVGVPVVAARAGIVEGLEEDQGEHPEDEPSSYEGNFVRIRHGDGTAAIYAHLAPHSLGVKLGDAVQTGQLLGRSGASGDVLAPHLHFAVIRRQTNASGWREEVSVPMTFFVGVPPVAFPPRAAVRVTAYYSGPARAPRAPSEWQPACALESRRAGALGRDSRLVPPGGLDCGRNRRRGVVLEVLAGIGLLVRWAPWQRRDPYPRDGGEAGVVAKRMSVCAYAGAVGSCMK